MSQPAAARMFVTFWGTRGSIPTPGASTEKYGGNTPCVCVTHQDSFIILDAGTGIRSLGIDMDTCDVRTDEIHLFLSHTHWDHIQGLPFFLPAYASGTKMTIYGSSKKGKFLAGILQRQMDVNYFPVEMAAFNADITINEVSDDTIKIGAVSVDLQEQTNHTGGSVRYMLSAGGKRIVYSTDIELDKIFGADKTDNEKKILLEYEEFIRGADLLIADGQYTAEEYAQKKNWGHSSIPALVELAHRNNVKQLAVFHHDPLHSDNTLDQLSIDYGGRYSAEDPPLDIFWAREGMTLAI